ncbi:MAG: 4'-phosphopantetheinyl transferase superfamily protein [Candidatus Tectomicrobia bacterium]|uniref:4'-phosphopantetheinyl transferase superfamily protein n=1 Tax=Tectimicrobiota bacterium TaxID=2528274 RepID=A0A937VZW1_UNCTE|nr:4'-phosphopantetheinyl transferase superfamily protein [Candidatus Tectomicrobia bacterium]
MSGAPTTWCPAPAVPRLAHNAVHIWRAPLAGTAAQIHWLWSLLSADERQRAARFVFPQDRDHFVMARGLLRVLLGHYCQQAPQQLCFTYGPQGKPALVIDTAAETLAFNVSHSHGLAVYALTWERAIGVDVERIRPQVAHESIAEHFFSPREVAVLRALPPAMQAEAFFACWTRKEAFIKARGEGLSLPLHQFDVALAPDASAALLWTAWDPHEAARWGMRDLDAAPHYRAAVVVAGHDWHLTCYETPAAYLPTLC